MASGDTAAASRPRRDRSRSPAPDRPNKKKNLAKGFKFQKKTARNDEDVDQRQYRDREEEYRPKRFGGKEDRQKFAERNRDREDNPPKDSNQPPRGPKQDNSNKDDKKPKQPKPKNQMAAASSSSSTAFILVTVNDRLGTKATIPCLPSDTIGDFKKLVAAQIGRTPGEIMLKRQSERPFKDHITLADYGVGNGVQLVCPLHSQFRMLLVSNFSFCTSCSTLTAMI